MTGNPLLVLEALAQSVWLDYTDRVPKLGSKAAYLKQQMRDKLIEHREYIERHGQDMPEILEWQWPAAPGRSA